MTNEEMRAKLAALNSVEDAYALMKENGYSGTLEDFDALCAQAAEEIGPMDLDTLDEVAGGVSWAGVKETIGDAWDATKGAFNKSVDWVKANPKLTAEIGGGIASVVLIGCVAVGAYKHSQAKKTTTLENLFDDDNQSTHSGFYDDDDVTSSRPSSFGGENVPFRFSTPFD